MGTDIAEERAKLRAAPTVLEFFNTSYLPYIKSYKRSWETDESVFRNHILPVIGSDFIDAVTAERVGTVMRAVQSKLSAATCNKVLILLRYMFNLAIRWRTAHALGFDVIWPSQSPSPWPFSNSPEPWRCWDSPTPSFVPLSRR